MLSSGPCDPIRPESIRNNKIKKVKKSCYYKGEKREGEYNRITFWGDNIQEIPILCERKKCKEESERMETTRLEKMRYKDCMDE